MGEISDKVNKLIENILRSSTWTSAGEQRVDNFIKELRGSESFDIETDIKKFVDNESDTGKKFKLADKGNMGELNRFTSAQFGNVRELAQNPVGFIMSVFIKKFAKGVGVIAFAVIMFEVVKTIIKELLQPGRLLDLRFKRDITKEIMAFKRREDQQKIKQGFSNVIITTQTRLRATSGAQITNTLNMAGGRQPFPENIGQQNVMIVAASGVSLSKSNGRRSFRGTGR